MAIRDGAHVEGVFSRGERSRFFLAGTAGVSSSSSETEAGGETTTETTFLVGGMIGLHHFMTESASLDAALYLVYQTGGADLEAGGSTFEADVSGLVRSLSMSRVSARRWVHRPPRRRREPPSPRPHRNPHRSPRSRARSRLPPSFDRPRPLRYIPPFRGIAQPGSAHALGA